MREAGLKGRLRIVMQVHRQSLSLPGPPMRRGLAVLVILAIFGSLIAAPRLRSGVSADPMQILQPLGYLMADMLLRLDHASVC